MMELDFAPLVEAVAMLVATVAVPFVLLLANRWLGIQTTEKDAAALAAALRRGVSLGIHRYQSAPQGGSRAELVLEEAFGYVPEALSAHPFVVSTGGLNFRLANHAASTGGFDPAPLATRPPLRGGVGSYPASFIGGLPPTELAFSYPGHLWLVNDGYRLGWRWISRHPGAALLLAAVQARVFPGS